MAKHPGLEGEDHSLVPCYPAPIGFPGTEGQMSLRRREFIAGLGGAAAWPLAARAQQRSLPVVGWLSDSSAEDSVNRLAAFREGLEQAGFIEHQNVAIEYRWAG